MKIFIFRHAQKSMDFSGDPDLNSQGHAQAQELAKKVLSGELPRPTALWVSPKKRAQNTFRPLSEELQVPLQIKSELLEQQGHENTSGFRHRLQDVLNKAMDSGEEVLFLCSHYDVTVEFMSLIDADKDLSMFTHWHSCQYIGFDVQEPDFKLLCFERISV